MTYVNPYGEYLTEVMLICLLLSKRLEVEEGATVELKALMTGEGEKIAVGNEVAAKVTAKVVKQLKGAKVIVYKYKAKKNVRKKQGHRQLYTRIKIESIA